MVERILSIASDPDGTDPRPKLRFFQVLLLLHVTVRSIPTEFGVLDRVLALGLLACLAAVCLDRGSRLAMRIAAVLFAVKLAIIFPQTPNHGLLELVCLVLLATTDFESVPERQLLGQALRWVTVIVLFQTGLQKVLYGTYFDGQFLGHMIAADERFAAIFQHLVSGPELARLRSYAALEAGAGPFRVDAPVVLLASNATYLFEMVAPVLLMLPRTRTFAAVATILFFAAIQVAAREVYFGLLLVNLILLFPAGAWNRVAFPAFIVAYLVLAAAALGLVHLGFFN